MRKEYNLKSMKVIRRGPLVDAKHAKVSKTIRIDLDIVSWLLQESKKRRIPYQTIINTILKEAMDRGTKDSMEEIRAIINQELDKRKIKRAS